MAKRVLVFLARGAEDPEVVNTVYILRDSDIEVTLAGVEGPEPVRTERNILITPDCGINDIVNESFDAVIVPGGLVGAEVCEKSETLGIILRKHYEQGKLVGSICGGAKSLLANKIGLGKKLTSYPYFKETLAPHYDYKDDRVVQDGNIITSQGPGTSFEFALKLVEYLEGTDKMNAAKNNCLIRIN